MAILNQFKALREETLLEILTDGRYDDANLDLQLIDIKP